MQKSAVSKNIKAKVYMLFVHSINSQRQEYDNNMKRRSYQEFNLVEYSNKDLIKIKYWKLDKLDEATAELQ
jgi:hypothetical protein